MIIDGKKIAIKIYDSIKNEVNTMKKKPSLGAILVGNNASSLRYIHQKRKWAEYCGIHFNLLTFESDISESQLISEIKNLNGDAHTSGYIVQLPLPKHINEKNIINAISPNKDVDGFHPENVGKVLIGDDSGFVSCTPAGVMKIFEDLHINIEGKVVSIIGRSNIVGKPLAALLINAGATVISCNSKTIHLSKHTLDSDIIICATGVPGLLQANMIDSKAIIIDVGFTVIDGKIHGDAQFEDINSAGNLITPVPGGVGALTVAMLMSNTLKAEKGEK